MTVMQGTAEVTARELAELVIDALGLTDISLEDVDVKAPLFGGGLGLDSLDLLEISLIVQQRYGVKLKADDPLNVHIFASLQNLAEHIRGVQAAQR